MNCSQVGQVQKLQYNKFMGIVVVFPDCAWDNGCGGYPKLVGRHGTLGGNSSEMEWRRLEEFKVNLPSVAPLLRAIPEILSSQLRNNNSRFGE